MSEMVELINIEKITREQLLAIIKKHPKRISYLPHDVYLNDDELRFMSKNVLLDGEKAFGSSIIQN